MRGKQGYFSKEGSKNREVMSLQFDTYVLEWYLLLAGHKKYWVPKTW